jgi:hypothetical protein
MIEDDKISAKSVNEPVDKASTSFHMILHNVRDEVA